MSKVGKLFLFAIKGMARKREGQSKRDMQEKERVEKPETEYLLGQALLAVKMRFKPLLYFTLTVAGVFLYGFAVTEYAEDLWLYGIVGSISALASLGLLGWRRVALKKAEEKVVLYKRALEEEKQQKQKQKQEKDIASKQPSELFYLDLNALSSEQFEDVVKDLVVRMGFVAEKTQPSHDGGIDIWAYSDNALNGGRYIIQCKRWSSTVPVEIVRDLYGTLMREKADGGILITTSDISSDGQKFISEAAHNIPIKLIGGAQLRSLLNEREIAK